MNLLLAFYHNNEQNLKACITSTVIMLLWVELVKLLSKAFNLYAWQRRKLLHIFTGPLFLLTWPWFTIDTMGGMFASLVPLALTIKMTLVGLGIIRDDDMVSSVSRNGGKSELLKGPFLYGIIFIASTYLYWRTTIGIEAVFILCFGDGIAEITGRSYGDSNRLPWSPQKSFIGFLGFVISSIISSYLFLELNGNKVLLPNEIVQDNRLKRLIIVCIGSGLIETLPLSDIDNITVFISAILLEHICNYYILSL